MSPLWGRVGVGGPRPREAAEAGDHPPPQPSPTRGKGDRKLGAIEMDGDFNGVAPSPAGPRRGGGDLVGRFPRKSRYSQKEPSWGSAGSEVRPQTAPRTADPPFGRARSPSPLLRDSGR